MEDNADAVHSVLLELGIQNQFSSPFYGWLCIWPPNCPEYVKGLVVVEFNSQRSEERKLNRDRAIRAVKQSL
jgi:hypothetical protein